MAHTARFRGHLGPLRSYRAWLRALLAFMVLALAGFLIHRAVGQYSGEDVFASVLAIPTYRPQWTAFRLRSPPAGSYLFRPKTRDSALPNPSPLQGFVRSGTSFNASGQSIISL